MTHASTRARRAGTPRRNREEDSVAVRVSVPAFEQAHAADQRAAFQAGNLGGLWDALFCTAYTCPKELEPFPDEDGFVIVPRWALRAAREQIERLIAAEPGRSGKGSHRWRTQYRRDIRNATRLLFWRSVVETVPGIDLDEADEIVSVRFGISPSAVKQSRLKAQRRAIAYVPSAFLQDGLGGEWPRVDVLADVTSPCAGDDHNRRCHALFLEAVDKAKAHYLQRAKAARRPRTAT